MMERLDFTTEDKVNALLKAKSLGELYDMVGVQEEMQWPESSWIDGTLSTWIGEPPQENYGWYWLYQARKALMENKDKMSQDAWNKAYEYLLRAEASDWFWWYGNDQDSGQDYTFDRYLKTYLYEIYKLAGVEPPSYLYGNYFPDGQPYITRALDGLGEGDKKEYSSESALAKGVEVYFEGDGIHFLVKGDLNEFEVSLSSPDERIGNTFTILQKRPTELRYSLFPLSKDSVGMLITTHVSIRTGRPKFTRPRTTRQARKLETLPPRRPTPGVEVVVPFDYLSNPSDFYFAVSTVNENGELEVISSPVELKLPVQVKGAVIADIADPEGDDHGPGTYTYPTDSVFKPGVFDLLRFRMLEQADSYVMEFYFKDLGGNPWNGPNGFSLQIIEVYLDFKEGGNSSAIKMFPDGPGANVNLDPDHPWDVAFRIAGWDYGNLIVLPNGTTIQGEMQISADPTKNAIVVKLPKKYLPGVSDYGLYASVLVGSQDAMVRTSGDQLPLRRSSGRAVAPTHRQSLPALHRGFTTCSSQRLQANSGRTAQELRHRKRKTSDRSYDTSRRGHRRREAHRDRDPHKDDHNDDEQHRDHHYKHHRDSHNHHDYYNHIPRRRRKWQRIHHYQHLPRHRRW